MAFFSGKTKKKPVRAQRAGGESAADVKTAPKTPVVNKALSTDRNLSSVIIKPRITEKAVSMGERNVYAFVVKSGATKYDVRDAVKQLFNVTPVKVNIVNKAPRQYKSRSKGRIVSEKGLRKAYVYLKSGDSINLV